jgi:hypothetical protein
MISVEIGVAIVVAALVLLLMQRAASLLFLQLPELSLLPS